MDEDEVGEFLGLPSGVGTTPVAAQAGSAIPSIAQLHPVCVAVESRPPTSKQNDVYGEVRPTLPFPTPSPHCASWQLYGTLVEKSETKDQQTADSGYSDLFGDEGNTPSMEFKQLNSLHTNPSLGHEPLFPGRPPHAPPTHLMGCSVDVDETKIKPSVSLGSSQQLNNIRVTTPQKVRVWLLEM